MPLVQELQGLSSFDYTDPQISGPAFHAALQGLREQGWLAKGPYGYIVLDREAGEHFLRSRSTSFPGAAIAEIFQVQEGPLKEEMRRNILHLNGPDHGRLRRLLNPSLSPKAVQRHRPAIRELLEKLFAQIVADAQEKETVRCDLVQALAKPYPAQVIAHVVGAPLTDAPKLERWSHWIQRQFDAQSMLQQRDRIEVAVAEFYEYASDLLAKRRQDPGQDIISMLLAAEEEEGDRLSEAECVNLVLNVLVGGVDTTQSQLAHTLRLLAEHPDQWEALRREPQLAAQAVQEALRFEPVTPFTARIVEQEIVFRDVTFPKGTIVMVCAFTGNRDLEGDRDLASDRDIEDDRDPEGNRDVQVPASPGPPGSPDRFDIAAQRPHARNLTFGAGVHYCVGANLATAELEEALSFLAPRMRDLRLAGEPLYGSITGIYGLTELPVSFELA